MTPTEKHTSEAEELADNILRASGSGLRHYSMSRTREAILAAAQAGINKAKKETVLDITEALKLADETFRKIKYTGPERDVITIALVKAGIE